MLRGSLSQRAPESTHGYDVIDYGKLKPQIGSENDYDEWVETLHQHDMGQILDIVPNHMGVATNDNAWWNDVLENGPASQHADYFDIAWRSSPRPEFQDKILLPVLGAPYGEVLESGGLRLEFKGGRFLLNYGDRRFPITPSSDATILSHELVELEQTLGVENPTFLEFQSIITAAHNLPDSSEREADKIAERSREKEIIRRRLATLAAENPPIRAFIDKKLAQFNGNRGDSSSFNRLDELLEHQCYRLSYWRVAPDEINYRRFFDISDLAALSVEREEVFADAHRFVLDLVAEGKVDGLRIDHPDGLYDPAQYFRRLQQHFVLACARAEAQSNPAFQTLEWEELEAPLRERINAERTAADHEGRPWEPLYVVAEKILGADEPLVESWPIRGTSGYDFISMTNGLFVDRANEAAFTELYSQWIGDDTPYEEIVYHKKRMILKIALASELHVLTTQLDDLAQRNRRSRDFTFNSLHDALREVIACFPVYRSYIADEGPHDEDYQHVEQAIQRTTARNPLLSSSLFEFIGDMLLQRSPETFTEQDKADQRRFAGKFQQVTAPVTAKGVEDTAFYVYNRLVSLNEVGGEPGRFGATSQALHDFNQHRCQKWPYSLSPLSTHDTKRSEDVRARLNVLSEMPDPWRSCLERCAGLNEPCLAKIEDQTVPDANEQYLLYQTLVGAWPLEPHREGEYEQFVERIQAYMQKALHEAKVHTSWVHPNDEYDAALRASIARILDPHANSAFLEDFREFQRRVSGYGLFNSLSQTLLRITCPGVPDTYQGTEIWDFSLVDPDNRRPVDYTLRRRMLEELQAAESSAGDDLRTLAKTLLDAKEDGRIKLYVTAKALHCRRDHPGLFSHGEYIPLTVTGTRAEHLFAFARRDAGSHAIVVVPRFLSRLVPDVNRQPLGTAVWGDTQLSLAGVGTSLRWRNIFTGAEVAVSTSEDNNPSILLAEIFADFPIALFVGEQQD